MGGRDMLAWHGDIGMAHSFLSAIVTLCYAMLRFGSMRGFGGAGAVIIGGEGFGVAGWVRLG